jgi:glycine oxidase
VKTSDVIIAGGGIIGLSIALELRKHGAEVLVVERSEPGREASYAAAGMLACRDPELPELLRPLGMASAKLYPEFVHALEDESGMRVDYRRQGTILLLPESRQLPVQPAPPLSPEQLQNMEPHLASAGLCAAFLEEDTVDPRALVAALLKTLKHRGVEVALGSPVVEIRVEANQVTGVRTAKTTYGAPVVVNCVGAWGAQMAPYPLPTRPVKGQMLAVVSGNHNLLQHVVRAPEVYLVPRSDGRIIIGSTVEEAGFDKRVSPETARMLHQAATYLVPDLGEARIYEAWAGLRLGTPDDLPILGATDVHGYFVALGHFRNGILLTPITARLMGEVVRGLPPDFDLSAFSPARFA